MKKVLLINPWIYDFTAYDLWSKPLGLLYIASMLKKFGYSVGFIDCLDKYATGVKPKVKQYGTGKFNRNVIEKPKILKHIPRNYARYGIAESNFIELLQKHSDSDAVLVTSIMTYWYPGVKRVVELVREHLADVPIILGGIYSTIIPEHAEKIIQPDYIITGPGEIKIIRLLSEIFDISLDESKLPQSLDDYPFPDFSLINHLDYLVILTSRGCPYNCSFCAQKMVSMPFCQRSVDNVLAEFEYHYEKFGLKDFAFYDDALFINKKTHIEPILKGLLERNIDVRLHSPNGLFARQIDETLANLMFESNFRTVRLSFETSNLARQKDICSKVNNFDLARAVRNLMDAGYEPQDISAYVIMGLPGQPISEVEQSMEFVHSLGINIRLTSFSPIHRTAEFQRAVNMGYISPHIDPLLTNKSIYPLVDNPDKFEIFRQLRNRAGELNKKIRSN
ncbi:radical SAM protein [bacterium]|nr:MAG: radical SAM protein [bacterium]